MGMRGQAATEYLIILSVVVIIALIVVGVLGAFPAISGTVTRQQSEAYWQNAEIGIMPNYRLSGSTAELTVKNNKGFAIRLTGIKFDGRGDVAGSAVLLSPGSSVDMMVQGILLCTAGQQFGHAVSIMYEDQVTGRQFTFTGATQLTGTCQ
ncbi:MAG: hypothetical protein Q7T16_05035 [Candidatus Burarchaeum sp.]|nr:hypothetical protein [Candidatus Burarchaeum sp.]MDO8339994.1 hypothetical protein [Candidatus Burarchaeum sp.]